MKTLCPLALLLAVPALASAAAVDFEAQTKVLAGGKERPSITVIANEDADRVELELRRDDGKRFRFKTGRLRGGQQKRFALEVPAGAERRFAGTLTVAQGKQVSSVEVDFLAETVIPASLAADPTRFDPESRTMELTSTRTTTKVTVTAFGDRGQELGTRETLFDKAPPNTPLRVVWNQREGTLMKLLVQVHDEDNFYYALELFPWKVVIPHEEVNFALGSAQIARTEEPKLEQSLELIAQAVNDYGRFAEIRLFVGGHTDTVGDRRANRSLSLERAKAISAWFRKRGLSIPILFEGFGEEALKVATGEETAEEKNRRVEYIVAVEPPPIPAGLGTGGWKALR